MIIKWKQYVQISISKFIKKCSLYTGWSTKMSLFFFGNNFYKNKETFKMGAVGSRNFEVKI